MSQPHPMVSVIIPTLNEAEIIQTSLANLFSHDGDFEVIVSDGGSSDGTRDIVSQFAQVKQIALVKGRARQMNEGAKLARGELLLFLHADTALPPKAFHLINGAMSDCAVIGGCFCLAFDHRHLLLEIYSLFSRINHVLFTYGDQGLFVRTDIFRSLGGFRDMPIMEDVEIQTRLRPLGKFVKLGEPLVTSARRFKRGGIIRQQLLNTALVLSYRVGISPLCLKLFYGDSRERSR